MAPTVACTVACRGAVADELLHSGGGGGAAGLRVVRRRHGKVWGGLRSCVATQGGNVAAAPANGAEEGDELRRAAAGATGLEIRKEKYEGKEGSEADLHVGSDNFFVHRGGRRN